MMSKRNIVVMALLMLVLSMTTQAETKLVNRSVRRLVDGDYETTYISLEADYRNPKIESPEYIEFQVYMNSSTRDLSKYDELQEYLEVEVDGRYVEPEVIYEQQKVGEQIIRVLKIKNEFEGKPILVKETKEIILFFYGVGEIETRSFAYKLTVN